MKRLFDFSAALLGIVLLLPPGLLIAAAILLESRGGVFYRQKRIGKGGRPFLLWKFRTMHTGSDKKGLLTVGGRDPRVTRAGYVLRKYKLDELPQLLNVLTGDMSLVGPRPEVEKYVLLYNQRQRAVLSVRPGITDYASIRFSNENELLATVAEPEKFYIERIMPEKLELNLAYIHNQSVWKDVKIIFQTLLKIAGH